ncbi:ABC transporter permease [Rhodococcus rhodochrous]|jgi:ABC-type uncharacterized transport system permease subunit|uniref:ABC transporter permease n=1 Tax=Rhodococcus rhodochrous TaxID=1829 RepID=UPI0011A3AE3D|nr:ABC transporter permease [Rhodococcus rhodochrous]TWH44411.1 simple sugar transport system permease protein [Rhodococcus rhodochrous J38]
MITLENRLPAAHRFKSILPAGKFAGAIPPLVALVAALAIFVVLALVQGSTIDGLINALTKGVFGNPNYLQQVLTKAIPLVLAAVAVTIPARAGLVNVGGEGQLIMGGIVATGVGLALGSSLTGPLVWVVSAAGGALAGALWGGICAALRVWFNAPEGVTTLLMNFIALDIMLFLLYQPWKDPNGSGQPQSRPLEDSAILPMIPGTRISTALLVVIVVVFAAWWLMNKTSWGFKLTVAGGNSEVATRSGLSTVRLSLESMLLGGALAGLGGALNLLGVEGQLRPDVTATFGFVAFLAAFVCRNKVLPTAIVATVFAAILVASNPLQLRAGLDGSATYVLLGLLCLGLAVAPFTARRSS